MSHPTIKTKVAGIPCQVRVDWFDGQEGSFNYNAPSDHDFYGYLEIEFTVLDRAGRAAPWLDKKLTDADRDRITGEIESYIREEA